MNGGAQKIIPVGDIDFAYKYKKEHPEVILTGSLANSKAVAEYIKSILLDKPIDLAKEIKKLKFTSGAKFFDINQNDIFPKENFYLSTKPDIFNFVLRLNDENGLGIIERIDIND